MEPSLLERKDRSGESGLTCRLPCLRDETKLEELEADLEMGHKVAL